MPSVVVEIEDRVCRVRLNRPEKLNALDDTVWAELHAGLSSLHERPDVRVAVITGEGRCFSAGADLGGFGAAAGEGHAGRPERPAWAERRHAMGRWQRLLDLLEAVPQVTVAGIHGHCIGGGALLAVGCDIRVVTGDCRVRIPELAIGIPLTWAGVPRLVREVGLPMARDMVMTGRVLDAGEALQCGFAQRRVDDLVGGLAGVVGELLAMPSGPLAMTRSMFAAIGRAEMGAVGWADADLLSWSLREPESRAAGQAYARGRRETPS